MEHHHPRINTNSPIVLEVVTVETWRQPTWVVITRSLEVGITIKGVETIIAPTMDVVKKGVLIGSTTKLCNAWNGI
jgi:hypothetical protein